MHIFTTNRRFSYSLECLPPVSKGRKVVRQISNLDTSRWRLEEVGATTRAVQQANAGGELLAAWHKQALKQQKPLFTRGSIEVSQTAGGSK